MNKIKKVFIMAYARKNLGDDVFIKMLLEQNPNVDFFMKIQKPEFLKHFEKYSNFNIIEGNDTDEELYNQNILEYDAYVYIGGSIFMEGGKVYNLSEKFYCVLEKCKLNNIPFFYISCNYGPYKTEEYFNLSKRAFLECTDICFRDKYSYNLFSESSKVRYAPDLAFSYKFNKVNKIKDSVGISIIDLSIRNDLAKNENAYLSFLKRQIEQYINEGKKVYLYSFCEYEGDENAINKLLNKIHNENIFVVKYNGNLDEFLDIYSKMEYMICARFHAMVLSSITNTKMYVLSYSKKIDNVIEDLQFNLPIKHLMIEDFETDIKLEEFKLVEDNIISDVINQAKKQIEPFNKVVNN